MPDNRNRQRPIVEARRIMQKRRNAQRHNLPETSEPPDSVEANKEAT